MATGYQKLLQKRFPQSEDSPLPLQVVETAADLDRYDLILTMFLEIKKPRKRRSEEIYSRHFIYLTTSQLETP